MLFKDVSKTETIAEDVFRPEQHRIDGKLALDKRRNSQKPYIFDLRTPEEFAAGHLPGAYSLPFETFENSIYQMPYQGDIIMYGSERGEAAQAAQILYDNGFDSFSYCETFSEVFNALNESATEIILGKLPEEQRIPIIETILDEKIRPALAQDGGGLSVLSIEGNKVFVEYHGACGSCGSSTAGTLRFIENQLTISLNHDMEVIPS